MVGSLERFLVATLTNDDFTAKTREEVIAYMEATELLTDMGSDLERDIVWEAILSLDWVWVLQQIAPPEEEEADGYNTSEYETDSEEE